jgi:hypothetical protein
MNAAAKPTRRRRQIKTIEFDGQAVYVKKLVRDATDLLVTGRARSVTEAAEMLGYDRAHLSRMLNKPHNKMYLAYAARSHLFSAAPIAAQALVDLLRSDNGKVALDAARFVLGMQGIGPTERSGSSVNLHVSPGYIIDLSGKPHTSAEVVDAEDIEPIEDDTAALIKRLG